MAGRLPPTDATSKVLCRECSVTPRNLLHPRPSATTAEVFETLLSIPNGRLERIVSHGQSSPPGFWYDQPENEWVLILRGAARLGWEQGPPTELTPGDCVLIPAGTKHRVEWTTPDEPTVWLALFFQEANTVQRTDSVS